MILIITEQIFNQNDRCESDLTNRNKKAVLSQGIRAMPL